MTVGKNEQFRVLLLDDDAVITMVVTKAFRSSMPEAIVLVARTIAEAQMLISEYTFHFFILDVNLPDGTGLDFLCDLRTTCAEAMAVVITSTALPHHRDQVAGLGVLLFREKPVDPKEIIELACQHWSQLSNPGTGHQTEHFAASLSQLSPMDIIQLKCLTHVTQVLEFRAGKDVGRVYFDKGAIFHAETNTAIAEEALAQILGWRGGKVAEVIQDFESPQTIWTEWQALLLQVAQNIDEKPAQMP